MPTNMRLADHIRTVLEPILQDWEAFAKTGLRDHARGMLLASPDPIFVLDLAGRFIYANKATAELFALAPEQIIGQSTFDLGFSFAADFQLNLEQVMADQTPFRGKFVHKFASGQG